MKIFAVMQKGGKMIAFELTMPNKGSWNGRWSQEGQVFVRCYDQRKVPKEYWNKSFYYRWDDGWTACVTAHKVTTAEAKKLERQSKGFCGYDWMIRSIIQHGYIATKSELAEREEDG